MSTLSVNHNLMARGVSRQLSAHYDTLADSVRRLSSGLRVEQSADDAAGLAIRELMRADIKALGQGARNANDAISLIKTADGALAIIDEKLIRMKELAEQAATGTYDSTQRLMIDSEFQQMASEIERIARSTEFNGVKLLDGSLAGPHDGTGAGSEDGLSSTGALKVHFGTANDSAEDYYYVEIGACTLAGLGLAGRGINGAGATVTVGGLTANVNDYPGKGTEVLMPLDHIPQMEDVIQQQGTWYRGIYRDPPNAPYFWAEQDFMFIIPKGTKNIVVNMLSAKGTYPALSGQVSAVGDNDINVYTMDGTHLVGQTLVDRVYRSRTWASLPRPEDMFDNPVFKRMELLPFGSADYDGSNLNTGGNQYDGVTLTYSTYNGMNFGYSGDSDHFDDVPDNGAAETWEDYEILTIDEATEDLIVWMPGYGSAYFKAYWETDAQALERKEAPGEVVSIKTQELAQRALKRLDNAIVSKDQIRAHLGATQNRLENTVTNLNVQAESLQAAESRISDVDVATEMTTFVRNQVLTQSANSMLAQANAFPRMLLQLLQG